MTQTPGLEEGSELSGAATRARTRRSATYRWLVVFVSLLAFATRVYRLGSQSLWADEAKSVAVSSWPLFSIIAEQASHEHPPLHYMLLHFLMPLAGRSEFALRYVSLFFGVLLIPLLYLVGKMLAGERVGIIAALLAAVSPFYVRFAQEARMYTLAIFLSLLSTYFFLRIVAARDGTQWLGRTHRGRRLSFAYVVATTAALYSHYFTIFVVLVQMIYVLTAWGRHRIPLKPWLWRLLGVGLLFLPWVTLMVQGVLSIDPSLRTSGEAAGPNAPVAGLVSTWLEGRAGMVSLPTIFKQILISFGPSDFVRFEYATWLAVGLVVVTLLAMWMHPQPARLRKYFLLVYFCLPPILGYLVGFPANRPLWAKYLAVASPAYYLVLGLGLTIYLTAKELPVLGKYWRAVGVALIAGIIGLSSLGLRNYYVDARYGRYDYRPYIQALEVFSLPSDALITNPWTHFPTFWHYYQGGDAGSQPGPRVYFPLNWTDTEEELEAIAADHSGVWVIKNMPNDFDADGVIEGWLARRAFPTKTVWASNMFMRFYSFPAPAAVRQVDNMSYQGSPLLFGSEVGLTGYSIASQPHNYRHLLQLTLFWQAMEAMDESYIVYAHLVDAQGRIWGRNDTPPLAGFHPTSKWIPGERVEDRLGLLALPGTPPGEYWMRLGLYRADDGTQLPLSVPVDVADLVQAGDNLLLGPIHLGPIETPSPVEALAMDRSLEEAPALGDLELLGYNLEAAPIKPGDTIALTLFWRARAESGRDYHIVLRLEDEEGRVRAQSHEGATAGDYPLSQWAAGEVVRDLRELVVAGDAPSGSYRLVAGLVDLATNVEMDAISIDTLRVRDREREFTMPAVPHELEVNLADKVRLVGYDLTSGQVEGEGNVDWRMSVKPGDVLRLTLFWQGLSPMDVSYTVFTHLLDGDNMIWGQRDSAPGSGSLPTTGWLVDEVIVDEYEIPVKADAPAGEYVIEVGMYDAGTGQRLQVLSEEGAGMGDRVLLPVRVLVR